MGRQAKRKEGDSVALQPLTSENHYTQKPTSVPVTIDEHNA